MAHQKSTRDVGLLNRNKDVVLGAGTKVYFKTDIMADYVQICKMNTFGGVGEIADPKDKTSLEDTSKKYGSGMRDAPDKSFTGKYIPVQADGSDFKTEYENQQAFFAAATAELEVDIRIEWIDGLVTEFKMKTLGFEISETVVDDWRTWSVPGKQSTKPVFIQM